MTEYELVAPDTDLSWFFDCDHAWPTIVALRDDQVIGAISTRPINDMVICGPLLVAVSNPAFVATKLIAEYDLAMRDMGIKAYYLAIDKENGRWTRAIEKFIDRYSDGFHVEPIGDKEGRTWYKRIV